MRSEKTLFEVEREERWRVWALFGLLVVAIFVPLVPTAFVADGVMRLVIEAWEQVSSQRAAFQQWSSPSAAFLPLSRSLPEAVGIAVLLSLAVSLTAWFVSQRSPRERLLRLLGATPLDPTDAYHQRLQRVVEELCVAAGVPTAECVVVPGVALNAFSFDDAHGCGCIGVTEGALARLSRQQLQAVVAHEVAHLASRDCITATRACLLFLGLVQAERSIVPRQIGGPRGLPSFRVALGMMILAEVYALILLPAALVVWSGLRCIEFMASIVNLAISRQREYLADLSAARFTRDPVSLAEALELMSRHRGAAEPIPVGLSPLCICPVGATGVEAGGGGGRRTRRLSGASRGSWSSPGRRGATLANGWPRSSVACRAASTSRCPRAGAARPLRAWSPARCRPASTVRPAAGLCTP